MVATMYKNKQYVLVEPLHRLALYKIVAEAFHCVIFSAIADNRIRKERRVYYRVFFSVLQGSS